MSSRREAKPQSVPAYKWLNGREATHVSDQHFKLRRYGQPRLYNLTLWRWTISWRGRRLAVYRP